MRNLLTAIILSTTSVCSGGTLRISEVATKAAANTERMTLTSGTGDEVFFVKKEAIVGDADIKEAVPAYAPERQINVQLTDAAARKLKDTTSRMRHGRGRLAIIVEGRLVSAPVVYETIGSSFVISGFQHFDAGELDDLARKMSGRPPRPEGEDPVPAAPTPKIKTVPFTEEEYQRNKAVREGMGIFHIDVLPSEDELDKILRKGMSHAEVIKAFGNPSMGARKPADEDFFLFYRVAPEKRPENPRRKIFPDGFTVNFKGGKVAWWAHSFGNAVREEKVVGREPPTLKAALPDVDVTADEFDPIAFAEGIVIPDPKQDVNKRDLGDLIYMVRLLLSGLLLRDLQGDSGGAATLDADCDFIKALAHNFREVASLREKSNDGRIQVKALNDSLFPYVIGEKPLPTKNQEVEAGAGQPAAAPELEAK